MSGKFQRCVCEVCGAGGASRPEGLPCNCVRCGGQKTMKRAVYEMLLPFRHDYFSNYCFCDQCFVWRKLPGTITQKMDGGPECVELIFNQDNVKHDAMIDMLVALGPLKMFFITSLIHANETVTPLQWAKRIREIGPIAMYEHFQQGLTFNDIETLAQGVEALGVAQ